MKKEDLGGIAMLRDLMRDHLAEFKKGEECYKSTVQDIVGDVACHILNEIRLEVRNISKCGCAFSEGSVVEGCGCSVRTWNEAVDALELVKSDIKKIYVGEEIGKEDGR
mgnify:CR=1 FL=1